MDKLLILKKKCKACGEDINGFDIQGYCENCICDECGTPLETENEQAACLCDECSGN